MKAKKQTCQPGIEAKMSPKPVVNDQRYKGSNKLKNKVAIITGGDSGIGHAVALMFAKEGADIVIAYLNEHVDAKQTQQQIEKIGRKCILISGDLSKEAFCQKVVKQTIKIFKRLDILVNNAGEQHPQESVRKITAKQIQKTFHTNIFSYFYMVNAALPFLKKGSAIINTASVTAYKGSDNLLDYSSTKGAIVSFTRSLSESLVDKGIRVNGVAPGPVWTPLIVSTFSKKEIKEFGKNVPMKRPGQPEEIAPSYVFLASDDSSYMSGQMLHPNGGVIVNG
jgi:NAD(P)-dependent dehydrogenase (short-subunit alcohol dehydrogenase family)